MRPFKADWEKTAIPNEISARYIHKIVSTALPDTPLQSYEVLEGGCANVNIKLTFDTAKNRLLRLYLRDPTSVYREQAIAERIHQYIPVPRIEKISHFENIQYAICELKPGITLRDLWLNHTPADTTDIMYQVGQTLADFANFRFPAAGFFDETLSVKMTSSADDCLHFAQDCLKHPVVSTTLTKPLIRTIQQCLTENNQLLQIADDNQLVHGDFGPENILVHPVNQRWQISAILDWEFAFSGSMLWDIANLQRYAHHVPKHFETQFVRGLLGSGITLPNDWKKTTQLLNIISLLDCLKCTDPAASPQQCLDIQALLEYCVTTLAKNPS